MAFTSINKSNWQAWLICTITACAIAITFLFSPIPQDPAYHQFADRRILLGIPNFWNVMTNILFVFVGVYGIGKSARLRAFSIRGAYLVFCVGVLFVGFGSAYYHYSPTTQTLVWDRLPMTVAFMALFSIVISDRLSEQFGNRVIWLLVLAGVASVAFWYWSELEGKGDLRAYALIQFLPMLLMPLMLILCPCRGLSTAWLWGTLGIYALAKVAEHLDSCIYQATGLVSGHSIKHVLGSLAVLCAVFAMLRLRR